MMVFLFMTVTLANIHQSVSVVTFENLQEHLNFRTNTFLHLQYATVSKLVSHVHT